MFIYPRLALARDLLNEDGTKLYPNGRTKFVNDGWTWKCSREKVEWGINNCFIVID